jgi:hypothetical protein
MTRYYSERLWSVTAECHTITSIRPVEFQKENRKKKENVRKDLTSAVLASYGKTAVCIYSNILLNVTKTNSMQLAVLVSKRSLFGEFERCSTVAGTYSTATSMYQKVPTLDL